MVAAFNNIDPKAMEAKFNIRKAKVTSAVIDLMLDTMIDAEAMQKQELLDAHTKTGESRAKSSPGGRAGRYETGEMYREITASVDHDGKGNVVGTFGWVDPEDYFGYQDRGTDGNGRGGGGVPAAHTLFKTKIAASQAFMKRLAQLTKKGLY